jgi:amidohydrolase
VSYPNVQDAARRARDIFASLDDVLEIGHQLYEDLHANPELSGHEEKTAKKVLDILTSVGYSATGGLGGHGVLGVLENGEGPTVGLRGDTDALPIREQTGLPYASTVTSPGPDGELIPVMHACGHDMHTVALVNAAVALAEHRSSWSGTAVIIAQPAEETMEGAKGMLADGIFTEYPRPDVVIGQHCTPSRVGMVHHRSGPVYSACNNYRIRIFGKGGHGAAPHWTVDPIPIAAQVISALQTISSRRLAPDEMSVVTVGSIHAGTRPNVIPEYVDMELTLRAHSTETMDEIVSSMHRIVNGICSAGDSPRPPVIDLIESTFATINDEAVTVQLESIHGSLFAEEDIVPFPVVNYGSEDFAFYGTPGPGRYEGDAIPTAMWFFGTTEVGQWEETTGDSLIDRIGQVPVQHTPYYAPDAVPAVEQATKALLSGALAFLGGPRG